MNERCTALRIEWARCLTGAGFRKNIGIEALHVLCIDLWRARRASSAARGAFNINDDPVLAQQEKTTSIYQEGGLVVGF